MHLHNCVNDGRIYISTTKNENGQYETAVFPRKVVDMVWAYAIYEIQFNKCLHIVLATNIYQAIKNHIKCMFNFNSSNKQNIKS